MNQLTETSHATRTTNGRAPRLPTPASVLGGFLAELLEASGGLFLSALRSSESRRMVRLVRRLPRAQLLDGGWRPRRRPASARRRSARRSRAAGRPSWARAGRDAEGLS